MSIVHTLLLNLFDPGELGACGWHGLWMDMHDRCKCGPENRHHLDEHLKLRMDREIYLEVSLKSRFLAFVPDVNYLSLFILNHSCCLVVLFLSFSLRFSFIFFNYLSER